MDPPDREAYDSRCVSFGTHKISVSRYRMNGQWFAIAKQMWQIVSELTSDYWIALELMYQIHNQWLKQRATGVQFSDKGLHFSHPHLIAENLNFNFWLTH